MSEIPGIVNYNAQYNVINLLTRLNYVSVSIKLEYNVCRYFIKLEKNVITPNIKTLAVNKFQGLDKEVECILFT